MKEFTDNFLRSHMTDIQLSPHIDELRQAIEVLESQDNKSDQQQEELEQLKEKLSWFAGVYSS